MIKKFAMWLARITGLENDLRWKHYREIGGMLRQDACWFRSSYYGRAKSSPHAANVLFTIGDWLKRDACYDISTVRDIVYNAGQKIIKSMEDGKEDKL
jgi:hypothetical protein